MRGFQDNTLGPRVCIDGSTAEQAAADCSRAATTHNRSVARSRCSARPSCICPLPFLKDINTARVSWFADVGNAYKDYQDFSANTLRASTGISLHWQAPIGPLIISFAMPFRTQADDGHYEERIQFTFGSQF